MAIDLFLQIPLDSNRPSFFTPTRTNFYLPLHFSLYFDFFKFHSSFVLFFSHLKEKASKFARKRKIKRGIKIEMIRNIVTSFVIANFNWLLFVSHVHSVLFPPILPRYLRIFPFTLCSDCISVLDVNEILFIHHHAQPDSFVRFFLAFCFHIHSLLLPCDPVHLSGYNEMVNFVRFRESLF